MPNTLVSGPAGAGKSAVAKTLVALAEEPTVLVDFQAIHVALTGAERRSDGTYPLRDERLLPITEYVRRAVIGAAVERDIGVVATNSRWRPRTAGVPAGPARAPARTERIVDPGRVAVEARLSDPVTFELSATIAAEAINRWYTRIE